MRVTVQAALLLSAVAVVSATVFDITVDPGTSSVTGRSEGNPCPSFDNLPNSWSNPNNIATSGGGYADSQVNENDNRDCTEYLVADNWGFSSVLTDASWTAATYSVVGVELGVSVDITDGQDSASGHVQLRNATSQSIGTEASVSYTAGTSGYETQAAGGPTNTLGATLTPADIMDSDFGFHHYVDDSIKPGGGSTVSVRVDQVTLLVHLSVDASATDTTPDFGSIADTITVTGSNFVNTNNIAADSVLCRFNNDMLTDDPATFISDTEIRCTMPDLGASNIEDCDVQISLDSGATWTTAIHVDYYIAATAGTATPSSPDVSDVITISGSNFGRLTTFQCQFTSDATDEFVSASLVSNTVRCAMPNIPYTSSKDVTVAVSDNTGGFSTSSTTLSANLPDLGSISPASAYAGQTITVVGTGFFDDVTYAEVDGSAVTASYTSSVNLEITVPDLLSAGSKSVYVEFDNTAAPQTPSFTYTLPAASGRNPATVIGGTLLTVTGSSFGTTTTYQCLFDGGNAVIATRETDSRLTCTVPNLSNADIASVDVTVTSATFGSAGSAGTVAFNAPTVTGATPLTGTTGNTIAVTGTNLFSSAGAICVWDGGSVTSPLLVSTTTQANCDVPDLGLNSGTFTLEFAFDGTGTDLVLEDSIVLPFDFDYTQPPRSTGITSAYGSPRVGDTVTITGQNWFASGTYQCEFYTGATSVAYAPATQLGGASGTVECDLPFPTGITSATYSITVFVVIDSTLYPQTEESISMQLPRLCSVSPDPGSAAVKAGETITLSGDRFSRASTPGVCLFPDSGDSAPSTWLNDGTVTCEMPALSGVTEDTTVAVELSFDDGDSSIPTNGGCSSNNFDIAYDYVAPPDPTPKQEPSRQDDFPLVPVVGAGVGVVVLGAAVFAFRRRNLSSAGATSDLPQKQAPAPKKKAPPAKKKAPSAKKASAAAAAKKDSGNESQPAGEPSEDSAAKGDQSSAAAALLARRKNSSSRVGKPADAGNRSGSARRPSSSRKPSSGRKPSAGRSGRKASAAAAAAAAAAAGPIKGPKGVAAPAFLQALEFIEQRGLEETGIFRIAGSKVEENTVLGAMKNSPMGLDTSKVQDVHAVAGAVKAYLRQLAVVPFAATKELAAVMDGTADELDKVKQVLQKLPPRKFQVIKALASLLVKIEEKADVNKMGVEQLATVIGPNLCRDSSEAAGSLGAMQVGVKLANLLITSYDALF